MSIKYIIIMRYSFIINTSISINSIAYQQKQA